MSLRRNVSAAIGIMLLCIGLTAPVTSAQTGGSGLQLSPTRSEISANPGEQKTFKLTLTNITKGDFTAKAVLNDFESDNVDGTPKILVNSNQRTPYTINTMLKGLKDVDLKAGEKKEITLTLDVPGNAAPGAYYGAVRYSVVPKNANASENERQIALNASVAHLVLVEVPGNIVQQIRVESLKIQSGEKSHLIFLGKPNKAALAVKNLGNGFSRPFGKVEVKGPFGKKADSYDVNSTDPRAIVLPNSSRTFTNDLHGVSLPGRYSAVASVAYGNGGEVVNYKASFWYLPVWFLVALLVIIVLLVGGGYLLYRKRFAGKPLKKRK